VVVLIVEFYCNCLWLYTFTFSDIYFDYCMQIYIEMNKNVNC